MKKISTWVAIISGVIIALSTLAMTSSKIVLKEDFVRSLNEFHMRFDRLENLIHQILLEKKHGN